MIKKSTNFEDVGGRITKLGTVVGAMVTIVAATTGLCAWVSNQFQGVVSTQINELRNEIQINDRKTEQQITRLELANLIHNQPDNKAEIEKVARYYFVVLDGDWYMTGLYSQWATTHGGDISFIISKE